MMTDKRRYVAKKPTRTRKLVTPESVETGDAAKDGYTILSRKVLVEDRHPFAPWGNSRRGDGYGNTMDENEAQWASYED